jgi:hypothetical protein
MSRNTTRKGCSCQQIIELFFCRAKTARDEAGEILARFCFASEEDVLAQARKKRVKARP